MPEPDTWCLSEPHLLSCDLGKAGSLQMNEYDKQALLTISTIVTLLSSVNFASCFQSPFQTERDHGALSSLLNTSLVSC